MQRKLPARHILDKQITDKRKGKTLKGVRKIYLTLKATRIRMMGTFSTQKTVEIRKQL